MANTNINELKDDLLALIFLGLPPKSLYISICVCKLWKSIIKNSFFTSLHLRHKAADAAAMSEIYEDVNNSRCVMLLQSHFNYSCRTRDFFFSWHDEKSVHLNNDEWDTSTAIKFGLVKKDQKLSVIGFSGGIVCFNLHYSTYEEQVILWNPTIQQSFVLIRSFHQPKTLIVKGFGFDNISNDHKMVVLLEVIPFGESGRYLVNLYSLANGSWKSFPFNSKRCISRSDNRSVYFKGIIHWIVFYSEGNDYGILTFDIHNELFGYITFWSTITKNLSFTQDLTLFVVGNKFGALVCQGRLHYFDHFTMKKYGDSSSWEKVGEIDMSAGIPQQVGANVEIIIGDYLGSMKMFPFPSDDQKMGERDGHRVIAIFGSNCGPMETLSLLDKQIDYVKFSGGSIPIIKGETLVFGCKDNDEKQAMENFKMRYLEFCRGYLYGACL